MNVGETVKLDTEVLKEYEKVFEDFSTAFKKMAGNKKTYKVNYYKEAARNPKGKLCMKCSLKSNCDFSVLDFEGDNLNVWCAKIFVRAEK